ncbi:hypothetical protein F7018_05490 [Tenacibaculum aiptasiae]|uniref:Uncharacterized protein n=1 Tax=Tenacibaculum aiptasiae TaxID=426481 RepID=A0A7J5AS48_9FLAO|nr:hypothetical protein [Tenacibaculum aiptasiae]KAB1159763.1 hypothetical protein F7018_05490 [Tenacibaculum aiptasiae]
MTSFFSFEFVPNFSEEYIVARDNYKLEIKKVAKALDKVKKQAKGTVAYEKYLETKNIKDLAKKEYYEIKKEESYFGFKSFQLFLGEFGPWFCFFVYIFFMLYRSFILKENNLALRLLHSIMLIGPLFYFYWIFQPFQDLSKVSYYFAALISTLLIVLTIFFYTKIKKDKISILQNNLLEVAKFTFKNTKPEKREEMLDLIKEIARTSK